MTKKKSEKQKFTVPEDDREISLLRFSVRIDGNDDVLSVVRSRQIVNLIERTYGVKVTMAEYRRPGIRGFVQMQMEKVRGRRV
ncbi:hypothetical protein LOC71_19165 [Rhodopirellula sp. JC740]|uniref:Uncharacterized protein n=1 Tax=Rhodopirellula halodulae TaxID=2894198 RepID=A0ABS8NNN1_9BACT|nr:hypothetical protein [Rhodopirellula sp. JC740]MCC9644398.1 hypothetical protein [Rhodopirellula sp. JC740]